MLVVNFLGGPGVGKSTLATRLFSDLKMHDYNVEYCSEVAKDFVWEGRHKALRFQPYVATNQMFKLQKLEDEVQIAVTDSPFILSCLYKGTGYTDTFGKYLVEEFKKMNNTIFLLERSSTRKFNPKGRTQSEEEAIKLDTEIRDFLYTNGLLFNVIPLDKYSFTAASEEILELAMDDFAYQAELSNLHSKN